MSPIVDRKEARESGFAQVREALQSFEGDVVSAEFGQWGGKMIDEETGNPIPPREFLEINCVNVKVLTVSEELAMPIDEWNFRVNCSDFKGSFWVDVFLASADKFKLLIPDNLVGKRITWEKVTLEAVDKNGVRKPKFDATNFIIAGVGAASQATPAPAVVAAPAPAVVPDTGSGAATPVADPMEVEMELSVGNTDAQFRQAIALHPSFVNS